MSEIAAQARPYAQAVFKRARERTDFEGWSRMLQTAAQVAEDPRVRALIASPRVGSEELARVFLDICGDALGAEGGNLIRLLAENDRLAALPDIAALYELQRAEAEGTVEAQVISAYPLEERAERRIAEALKKRLGREVNITQRTDRALIAGAVVRAGDLVIDGSVRGRLARLASALSH
ncbi:MAG: F0F1 ATP synthase subunit delta [Gammaproteobacteria bacterium]|nr:F0F1 ATP synthase subunit delta [Gammaproteobacteria bacterium]